MAKEIERKFLVSNDSYKQLANRSINIIQAYLSTAPKATVRIRIAGERAFLTIKGKNNGAVRSEWEFQIPVEDAREMINECAVTNTIEKTRHYAGPWEIDEFGGRLAGLTVAEIELKNENDEFDNPGFIGREVTTDCRYFNSSLVTNNDLPPTE